MILWRHSKVFSNFAILLHHNYACIQCLSSKHVDIVLYLVRRDDETTINTIQETTVGMQEPGLNISLSVTLAKKHLSLGAVELSFQIWTVNSIVTGCSHCVKNIQGCLASYSGVCHIKQVCRSQRVCQPECPGCSRTHSILSLFSQEMKRRSGHRFRRRALLKDLKFKSISVELYPSSQCSEFPV